MLESKIVKDGAQFLIEVNGVRVPMYGYMSYQPARARYEDFKKIGVQLLFTGVYAGDRGINQGSAIRPFRPGFWRGPNEFDFSAVDEDFRRLRGDAVPGEVYIIPRLMLEAPSWWERLHPDELCIDAQGTPLHQSFSSDQWIADCGHVMRAFQDWLTSSGWSQYVVGWHLAGGNTEEFIRPRLHPLHFSDYGPRATAHFQASLRNRYQVIEALNAAWRVELGDFDEALPSSPAQRAYARNGALRDPEWEAHSVDYYRFYSESLAQAIIRLCETAKEITGHRQIMGAFYGYTVNVPNPEQGHHAMNLLLASKAVDFLASPFTYMDNRGQGVDWPFQGCVDSTALRGKPWFLEADVRTCLSRPISECMSFANPLANDLYDGPVWLGPDSLAGSLGQMGKAFARILTSHTAIWWFDMWGGWYNHDAMMDFHRRARALYSREALSGTAQANAQIAVFADEKTFSCIAPDDPYAQQVLNDLLRQLGWIGAPYQLFLMDDLARISPAGYRMAIFPSVLRWRPEWKQALAAWCADGRSILMTGEPDLYGEGATPLTGLSWTRAEAIERLEDVQMGARAQEVAVRGMRMLPAQEDVVLARFESGEAAIAMRREVNCQRIWSRLLAPTADLLRKLALLAGTHIYCYTNDVVYADSRFVAIHARTAGSKRLYFPQKGALTDALSGEALPGNETFADLRMDFGETRLFEFRAE